MVNPKLNVTLFIHSIIILLYFFTQGMEEYNFVPYDVGSGNELER